MSLQKRIVPLTQIKGNMEEIFDYTGIQLGDDGTRFIGGAATTIAALRLDDGDQAPIGSVYNSIAPGIFHRKITDTKTNADWVAIGTGGGGGVAGVTGFYVDNTIPTAPVITVPKNNLTAVLVPTNMNDNTQGYTTGSFWYDTLTTTLWVAQTVGTGAAVWAKVLVGQGKNNPTAVIAPTVNDDNTLGYSIGSMWFDSVTGFLYVAQSVGTGTAIWLAVNAGGSSSAYSLGVAAIFSSLSGGTFTVTNPGLLVPTGDIGGSANVNPANTTFGTGSFVGASPAAQAATLVLYNQLKVLPTTNPVDLSTGNLGDTNIGYGLGVFVPGVYAASAAVSVVAGKTITFNGDGDYVFIIPAALTFGATVNMVLTNGAKASRIFFVVGTVTAGSSMTTGTTDSLIGTFMLGNAGVTITIGSTNTIQGRILTTGAEVTVIDGTASSIFQPLS